MNDRKIDAEAGSDLSDPLLRSVAFSAAAIRSLMAAGIIGFIPALLAGFLICAGRLRDGGASFSYAVMIGTVVGLVTGVMAIKSPATAIGLFFVCLIATLVCWLVTGRWWRNAATAGTNSAG